MNASPVGPAGYAMICVFARRSGFSSFMLDTTEPEFVMTPTVPARYALLFQLSSPVIASGGISPSSYKLAINLSASSVSGELTVTFPFSSTGIPPQSSIMVLQNPSASPPPDAPMANPRP